MSTNLMVYLEEVMCGQHLSVH